MPLVLITIAVACSFCGVLCASGNESQDRPNVILIMLDDLGIADLGCYGGQVVKTPNIDLLAEQGVRFTNAYSGSVVCAPARCILMTGKHSGHCSVRTNSGGVPLPDADYTIAELVKSQGYKTAGFGKWCLGIPQSEGDPQQQGFDHFFGYYHQSHAHIQFPEYLVRDGVREILSGNLNSKMTKDRIGFFDDSTSDDRQLEFAHYRIMSELKEFISQNHNEDFFCYVPITMPHGRFQMPSSDPAAKKFADKDWSEKAKVAAAMISMTDRQIGQLRQLLVDLEISQKTMIVICSDHGPAARYEGELNSAGPYKGFKRSVYEGGIRIPMIIHCPDLITPKTSDLPVYLGDMITTMADLCGGASELPTDLDSISFAPTLNDRFGEQQKHEALIWNWARYNPNSQRYGESMQAIRVGDWKLLRNTESDPWELYDLGRDPFEERNEAANHPQMVADLVKRIETQITNPLPQREALQVWHNEFLSTEKPGENLSTRQ